MRLCDKYCLHFAKHCNRNTTYEALRIVSFSETFCSVWKVRNNEMLAKCGELVFLQPMVYECGDSEEQESSRSRRPRL